MKRKPLNILFVSRDKFPPFRVDVAVLFGKELVRKKHNVDWVLQSDGDCRKAYKTQWMGGAAWVGPTNNGNKFLNRAFKHLLRFIHTTKKTVLLLQKRYDIVLVKDSFVSAVVYLVMAKMVGVKYIYWLSYPVVEALLYAIKEKTARYPFFYLIRGCFYKVLLYSLLLKHANHIFIQSEQMRKDINAQGIDKNKLTAIPMGIDSELMEFDRSCENEFELESNHPILVYLGTLIRLRRIDFVLRVLAHVLEKVPETRLYLVGKGEAKEDLEVLKNEACRLGILHAVIFTGFLERKKALQIVKSADICLSPFYPTPILNSTSPTKLLEYMALGKAVVVNDHPEQKCIIEESGGGVCVPYRVKDFSEAIIFLLNDPKLNRCMGKKGKEWVFSNRTYSKIVENVEATLYRSLD